MPPGSTHQFLRERQQCGDVFLLIERPQSRRIGRSEPTSTRRETLYDLSHTLQTRGLDAHVMASNGLQGTGEIRDCGRRLPALAVEKNRSPNLKALSSTRSVKEVSVAGSRPIRT